MRRKKAQNQKHPAALLRRHMGGAREFLTQTLVHLRFGATCAGKTLLTTLTTIGCDEQ